MRGALASALLSLCGLVQADYGPYIQSGDYDAGKFGSWPTETYRSTPIIGPTLNYLESSTQCKDGQYTLISPRGGGVATPGPMIIDQDGHLVWTKDYGKTYNLNVYRYRGQDYLTFWAGNDGITGHGDGTYYMLDSNYQEAYKIRGANGLPADLHEFHITLNETAVFTIYETRSADLRSVEDGPQDGWIYDGTFQEVDIETGELLFQWRASDHFTFAEMFRGREGNGESESRPWDFFHINSIDKDVMGNFLVSSRYANCLAYIDGHSGSVLWRLGGANNSFTDLSPSQSATNITWQHHARFHSPNKTTSLTVFDNASRGIGAPTLTSRGLYLDLDTTAMTVSIRHEYWNPHPISSQSQGSVQVLDSGNVLLGYGFNAAWTEYNIHGDVLCHVHFGPQTGFGIGDIISYRVFKHPWVGLPLTRPDLAVYAYEAAVSWNGATEVATWVLQGVSSSSSPSDSDDSDNDALTSPSFNFLAAVPKNGFETILPIPLHIQKQALRVVALNATGQVLGVSRFVAWDPASNEAAVTYGMGESGGIVLTGPVRSFVFYVIGFVSAVVVLVGIGLANRYLGERVRSAKRDRERGNWVPVDNDGFNGDEEDLSDGELSDGIEFSLLGNPRLASYEDVVGGRRDRFVDGEHTG
ncbi:hypothetical protein P170DRAFT_348536 [Aspergillus steynii IBT 23096]|uniref:Arylsulfotransferase n=1 Tax=Aspergillus steynii IBT 23096 TaxID=1392250 RepID=A0A2I2GGR4_9EURO|nr:uncharacterized protein P170DRAFT_348536 [Aspergillus steynii IBT 23096]PLB52060.1 hypothetical protein P170DRAFT_348536 [Aspergillus steynii IBT 23096]